MASTFLFRTRSGSDHLLSLVLQLPQILILTRSMGSGPRTYPGGLTKWQYKRVQEKIARGKANRLLRTEKQVYLSRLRSGTRPDPSQPESKDHIKALADRFTKPGAEDLWNQDDGPVRDPPKKLLENPPSIPQLSAGSFVQKRGYSAGRKWRGNPSSEEESESESEPDSVRGLRRIPMFSSAALRDSEPNVKREKTPGEGRRRRSKEIQQIYDEFSNRKEVARMEERWVKPKGESVISKKRFCLFLREKKNILPAV